MPVSYDLPRANSNWSEIDRNKYNKLDFYLAVLGARNAAYWPTYQKMYGSIDWQPNMGTTLRGVLDEPSPIQRSEAVPNLIDTAPKKDVIETEEATEDARIRRHNFESKLFSFVGPFQDFMKNKIPTHSKDIMRQMAIFNDFFYRSFMFHHATSVIVAGAGIDGNGESWLKQTGVPSHNDPSTDFTAAKDAAFRQNMIAALGEDGTLNFKRMKAYANYLREELFADPFEGAYNTSEATNETIKGKYCFVGANETYAALTEDDDVISKKNDVMDLVHSEFSGLINGFVLYKAERYPLRMAEDGTFPYPEIQIEEGPLNKRTRINPDYKNAPYMISFLCGGNAYKGTRIGPAPSEFSKKNVSKEKFHSLSWNGEVRITDDVLLNYGGGVYDTNKYGEYLQLYADAVFGAIPVNRDHVIPVIHKRSTLL